LQVVTGHAPVVILVHDHPHPVGHGGLVDPVQVCHRDAYRYQHRRVVANAVNAFQRSAVDHRLGVRVGVAEQRLDVLDVVVGTEHAVQGPAGPLDEPGHALVDVVLFVAEHIHHRLGGGVDETLDAGAVRIGLTLLIDLETHAAGQRHDPNQAGGERDPPAPPAVRRSARRRTYRIILPLDRL